MSESDGNTNQPAVKDEDAEHPVATEWRRAFQQIVKALVDGDYDLSGGVASVAPISSALADQMRSYVADYGESLVELPEETWNTSVTQWMGTYWAVLVDLWTKESGPSDLVLHARVFEVGDGVFRIEVHSVHVP